MLSNTRLDEYAVRLRERKYIPRPDQVASLMNCEVEDLVVEIQNVRRNLHRLKKRVYDGAATGAIYAEISDLLEGKYR